MPTLTKADAEVLLADYFADWVKALDIRFDEVAPEGVVLRMPLAERLYRSGGTVCGQALMALADTTMVFTLSAALGGFRPMTTVNQSTNFMKPISNADVVARGRPLRIGKSMAFGEVLLYADGAEAPAVQVSSAYALLPG
jgi:uncharacterized protein (TIGR00369 family)